MITGFSEMGSDVLNDDFERVAFNRQRAETLSSVFLYDEDEEARAKVDADDYASVYSVPRMRGDESLHVLGRELALTVDTDLADMPMDLAQRAIERVEDEGRRNGYRERLQQLGANGGDTAQDYYRLYAQVQRDNVQIPYREAVAKTEERKAALTGLFGELVAAGGYKTHDAWKRFYEGQAREVFTAGDEASINKAADAWGMMRGMVYEYEDAAANVLAQASTGGLIMDCLRGDELAQGLFFRQLQTHIQDMKTDAKERNFFKRAWQAFEAADKQLVAGVLGGHFKAFVTDEQVDDYNRELERAREISGLENPNVAFYAEGDNWAEKHLGLHNARLGAVHSAARASGQLNADGSLRYMTKEERRGTQELNEFRGKLFNATQGMYDIDGFAAKFGKMLPSSALYLVPGGVFANAASMYTQDLAQQLGEGTIWTRASAKASANAAIQAGVEKIAFGSLKAGRMVPGLDWLMSRQVMARTLGGLYGTTAGRIGMGAAVGAAEESFVEPLAGLLLSGAYNAVASEELQRDDPVAEWRKETAEMLEPDQLLATAIYGLLLGGVSYSGQKAAAQEYRNVRDHLMAIGVDEGRAAAVARIDDPVERRVAEQALVNERLKTDSKGVLAYVAELYPQLQPMATVENYFDKGLLPRVLPAGDGQVKVQEQDVNGEVTETIMSEAAARLLVESRLEELSAKEQVEMADMVLANAMVGSVSKDGERWVVSLEEDKMNHEYFQRLARAAGLRLSEGARPEDVDPEVHAHIPLGQLAQQGKAWEQRMKVARHDYEQKKGKPVSDAEWARVSKRFESRVNRTGVRGADKRLRTVLRVARGKFGAMEVLEDVTEDNLVRDMEEHGRTLDYYISNLRELEGALGKPGAFLRELKDGETEGDRRMAVIEAMGKLVQSKVLADTAKSGNKLSAALNAFLDLIRGWVLQAKAMFKLGEAVNTVLTNPEAAAKMDKEFREDVERLVAQDVEFLQNIQLADGLEAMQRVYEAHDKAKADRKVKRRKRAKTPVLDAAEAKHGEDVRKEQAEMEKTQAEVQADVEAAEAAVDGDFTSSAVNQDELDAIKAAAEKDGTFMKAPNGKPTNLTERQWLQVRTKAFKEWFGDWESAAYQQHFRNRLLGVLTPENIRRVKAKEYDAVKNMGFDTRVKPMAYIPVEIARLMGDYVTNNLIYGSDFRFLEHVSKRHSDVEAYCEEYVDKLLSAFASPDKVFFDTRNKSYVFAKGEYAYFLSVASAPEDGERYIQWKTAFRGNEPTGSRYKEIWNKNDREPVDAELHDKGPTLKESPSARLSDLGSKRNIKEVVRDVKPENVSKVVDENGEPLVVTHATNAEPFTVFHRGERAGLSGKGIYFSPDGVGIWGKNIMRCFLNVRNPLTKENAPREVNNGGMSAVVPDVFEKFPEFDGVMIRRDEITVRDPEQIKSATDNRGTFDGSSDDITLSVTDAQESGLFTDGVLEAANAIVVAPDASFSVTALHASPHKFRKFSTEKMGSGEGHQAFGWGLYFAESEDVNREYHRQFSQQTSEFMLDGKKVRELELIEFLNEQVGYEVADYVLLAVKEAWDTGPRIKKVQAEKKQYEEWLKTPLESPYADWQLKRLIPGQKAQLKALRFVKKHKIMRVGAMNYRVELNVDESNLLMWDKAVPAELHEAVRTLEDGKQTGGMIAMPEAGKETWPGYRIYNELARKLGQNVQDLLSPKFGQGPKLASEWLLAHGYKGIKYLDGMSRAAGEGSYNYVIFSGDDVKITGVNESGDYKAPWDEYEDVDASFNVIGPSAKTWDKYEDSRKFKGRDDGKERVEIDASRAKLTPRAFLGDAGDEYRLLVAGKAMPFGVQDDLEKLREQQKLIDGYYHILFETDDVEKALAYNDEHGLSKEWFDAHEKLKKGVRDFVIKQLQLAGVSGDGKYGSLSKTNSRLIGAIMESMTAGKVDEDVAAELDRMSGGHIKCLKDILDYEELYEAYPDLKWLPVSVADLGYQLRGQLTVKGDYPDSIMLNERLDNEGRRSTLLHEIQHAIQTIEEFARGGTAEMASKLLEKQVRQYRIRLEHLRHEQRWLYAVDTAKDHLQRMLRLLKRPRSILKMGERFAVHEMQHVPTMAAQAIEMMWKEYTEIAMRDYGDSVAYAPGEGYKLPGHGDKKPTLEAVEEMLEKLKALPSRRAGTLRGRRQKVEAEIERLYEENKHKLNMTDMSGSELYQRLAGEIEARNVQERRDWTMAERLARPFNDTLEYPGEALVSFSVVISKDRICNTRAEARAMVGRKGAPLKLENRFLDIEAVFNAKSEGKFSDKNSIGRTFEALADSGLSDDEIKRVHYTAFGNVEQLFANAESMQFERAYKKKEERKGFLQVFSPFEVEGWNASNVARIELEIHQESGHLPTAYLLNVNIEKKPLFLGRRGAGAEPFNRTEATHIREDFPGIVKENQHNVNADFTSSVVNLDERALAYEVVAAGQGFRANLAFSEQIVREMRGALQRMKKLGSKTATEREDAIAAMGTMVQVVKAAVAYLPQGYRFSVHPYLNKLEVLAELATTGDLKMTRDMANKTIKEWLKLNQGIDEVVAVKGQELDRQTSATELAKDYGEMQLQEAMEAIIHRVAGQLRKHAKDRAVLKIKELVERLAPKKDPKTGKLKGGKMSADAYRDLEDVAKAMNMDTEELEAKLAALRAEMEKPGIDEERRAQLESEMTLYDQFGDLQSMTAEEAVEALEALRQRVWFHRFEWDNVQAERRAARRAMVRSVVDGVGDVGQNEYNAKKRAKKPTQRLKNLADILSGMPAVLTGLRGYLPLHKLADDLARRANRAGEAIKKWEAERWVALEALSRETLGKSWRKSMDFMHEVLPTGVTFNRPKYRSVSVKTAALRELLAMTPEERRAEMNRRQKAGGLEAESVLTERDIEELEKQLLAMEEAGKVLSTVEVRYVERVQREENLQLSRGEALYAILMWEQPTYTERMEEQGYTPEVIAGFKRFIGEGMLQFGYGLRELFAQQGERIARVYEATFGVPFPREENYFAARWNVTGMKENSAEQLLAGMAGTPGAGNGWMKQRVKHNLELDMTKDALQVFLQATTLTDTWMATQDIVADFKAWTRDPDFDRAMMSVLGKDDYENLKDWIRIIEQGGVQDCLNMGVAQDVINGLYASGAVAILGFRIQTLLRQLPSIFNGLLGAHDISAGEWLATLSRMKKAEAPMTYKRMMNSTLIQNRRQGKAGNMAGQAMRSNDTASSMTEGMLLASMLPMEWVDASCTAMSLVPVWNVYYQRAIDKGASVQEAEQAAWEQTAIVANLSAQPIGRLNKSKIAQSRNPLVKAVFYMLSENMAKFALCRALWRGGKKKAAWRAWLMYGAANAVISALLDALQGDPEEFEKGKWWEYLLSAIYGPLASIPGVGEAVEALGTLVLLKVPGHIFDIDVLKKAKTHASVGRAMLDAQGFIKAWMKIYGYMTDDEEHSLAEYTRAASTISRTMAIGTGWMGNAVGYWSTVVAVLLNPLDFGARVWRNMKHYFD
ncbi:MAG: hypothetical protein IKZ07_05845 [Akkermansia sp.]|nr:hypothetical protein [Akkermansia sp.]